MSVNYDSPSHHDYSSWTDKELYIAIETDPACAHEYVAELNARAADRAAHVERVERVNSQYGLVPTAAEYGLPPRTAYGIDTDYLSTARPLTWREKLAYYVSRLRTYLGI